MVNTLGFERAPSQPWRSPIKSLTHWTRHGWNGSLGLLLPFLGWIDMYSCLLKENQEAPFQPPMLHLPLLLKKKPRSMLSSLSPHTWPSEVWSSLFLSSYSTATILAFIMVLKHHALALCTLLVIWWFFPEASMWLRSPPCLLSSSQEGLLWSPFYSSVTTSRSLVEYAPTTPCYSPSICLGMTLFHCLVLYGLFSNTKRSV